MSMSLVTHSWVFYAATGIFIVSVVIFLYMASGSKAKNAAQDAWEAMMRNALRQTFEGISEERLSAMVESARKETFGDKK